MVVHHHNDHEINASLAEPEARVAITDDDESDDDDINDSDEDSENSFEEQGFDKEEIEEAEKDREYFPIDEIQLVF